MSIIGKRVGFNEITYPNGSRQEPVRTACIGVIVDTILVSAYVTTNAAATKTCYVIEVEPVN